MTVDGNSNRVTVDIFGVTLLVEKYVRGTPMKKVIIITVALTIAFAGAAIYLFVANRQMTDRYSFLDE